MEEIPLCSTCNDAFTRSPLLPTPEQFTQLLHILRTDSGHRVHATTLQFMASVRKEIARYDKQLEVFEPIFEKLYADRTVLRQLYDQYSGLANAPVRRLPNEVLVEIFRLCESDARTEPSRDPILPQSWDHESKKELRRVGGGHLVALSQVSAHWRHLVLGTPTLWSTITLDLRCWEHAVANPSRAHQQMIELLHLAIVRGQQTPLTIQVTGAGPCHPLALQTLASAAPRWRTARFAVDSELLLHLADITGRLPLLETLQINALAEDVETLREVGRFFASAPRLRSVAFRGPLAAIGDLPIEQLGYCQYNGLVAEDLVPLLLHMQRLPNSELHLQLDCHAIATALPLQLPDVVSPVEEITLYSAAHGGLESGPVLGALFDALTLPEMQRLNLLGTSDMGGHPFHWPHAEARALFLRSGSQEVLQSLSLHDVIIAEHELLDCLRLLPALTYLFISDQAAKLDADGTVTPAHLLITDSLLRQLAPLVPRLEIVDMKTLGAFSDQALIEFARHRSALAISASASGHGELAPFECVLLWLSGTVRDETQMSHTLAVLRSLVDGGGLIFDARMYDPVVDV
ncbi:hypothetical protein C8R46DRAFT_35107 [Mycena filopes]|nr:hypothetical protein C8R46DRAFT_35107 [Mycena filopes]